eukprot:791768_1
MKYFAFHECLVLGCGGIYYIQPDIGVLCLGKWNYNYQTVATWSIEEKYTKGQSFDIEAAITTKVNVTVQVYINDNFIGTWVEDQSPMWTKGSIGLRNYQLPAVYT